jgi:hypothetical protein
VENEKQESVQEERRFEPKVINDPNCDHFYEEIGRDGEGVMQVRCLKCPMGRRITDEYRCREGRIEHIN